MDTREHQHSRQQNRVYNSTERSDGISDHQSNFITYSKIAVPNAKDAIHVQIKAEQTTFFQITANHISLNVYTHRINPEEASKCSLCDNNQETVAHPSLE